MTLIVFAVGGVLAPAIHRVQHGLEWHHSKHESDTPRCDHSDHDVAFEKRLADLNDEPCTICTVKPTFEAELQEAYDLVFHPTLSSVDGVIGSDASHFRFHESRGPPNLTLFV